MLTVEQQHAAVLDCCQRLTASFAATEKHTLIAALRSELASLLSANLIKEESELIGPIRQMPPVSRPQQFAEISEDAASLRSRYSAHVGRWTLAAVDHDMQEYQQAALALIDEVRRHIQWKRRLLPMWRHAIQSTLPQEL